MLALAKGRRKVCFVEVLCALPSNRVKTYAV
jgi:hypothetical protein